MPLAFTPACAALLRGSLPHSNAAQAIALMQELTPELPTWPVVAPRSFRESARAQAAAGFPGLQVDSEREQICVDRAAAERGLDRVGLAYLRGEAGAGAPPADYAAGIGDLLRLVGAGRARGLKGEVLGPVSLALQLTDEHERPLAYDPALREALVQHLTLRATWLYGQLRAFADNVIICLDEPFLDALGSPLCPLTWEEGCALIDQMLSAIPGRRGVSTGGALNWGLLLATRADLVIFDAFDHSAALIQAAEAVGGFLRRGGTLGWGLVPNDPAALAHEQVATLAGRFARSVEYLAAASGLDQHLIVDAALITSSGSLAHLSAEAAEQALRMCAAVARRVRDESGRPVAA